jgi:hypothetical protein
VVEVLVSYGRASYTVVRLPAQAENSTRPIALSNSARPGGLDGDRTFTLVQGLQTQKGAAASEDRQVRPNRLDIESPWLQFTMAFQRC